MVHRGIVDVFNIGAAFEKMEKTMPVIISFLVIDFICLVAMAPGVVKIFAEIKDAD